MDTHINFTFKQASHFNILALKLANRGKVVLRYNCYEKIATQSLFKRSDCCHRRTDFKEENHHPLWVFNSQSAKNYNSKLYNRRCQ